MTSFSANLRTPATPQQLLSEQVRRILAAPVYDLAIETPLQVAPALSASLGNQVLLKREDLQPTVSFKIRGAYTRLSRLTPAQRERGVITASAGNHAQGVALAASHLGLKATIVMPTTTPSLKVEGVRSRGGHVVLHGDGLELAGARRLRRIAKACRDFGQRAQYSVFEIEVDAAQWVALKARLMQIIDPPRTASGSTTWANTGAARSNTSAQSPCWTSTPPWAARASAPCSCACSSRCRPGSRANR